MSGWMYGVAVLLALYVIFVLAIAKCIAFGDSDERAL